MLHDLWASVFKDYTKPQQVGILKSLHFVSHIPYLSIQFANCRNDFFVNGYCRQANKLVANPLHSKYTYLDVTKTCSFLSWKYSAI